jgi:RND family efflux transporter MFP subunit
MKNYRIAFLSALTVAIMLAAALGFVVWRSYGRGRINPANLQPTGAASPSPGATGEANATAASPPATPLAPVQLSPQRLQTISVKTGVVEVKPVYNEIRTVGNVDVDEQLLSYIQLRFAGWIQQVFANYTYQYVHKGQPLFTIYSPGLVTTEREYLIAEQNKNLLAASTVPGVASGAASLLGAAAERLQQWQIPSREITRLKATREVRNELEIDSPVSGFITERNALPHMYAQPETRLYAIANLSTVWVYADVFQNEIGQIRVGDPASVTVDAYPGRNFFGRVDYIWPQVDINTRTVKVRLVFHNASLELTPGMFVNVDLKVWLGRHLAVPASAVFHTGTSDIVFIDQGGGYLVPRTVTLGPRAGDDYAVLRGLKAGQTVVTSANFLIDSESQLQAAIGSFVPPPPGAGAAAAMNAPRVPEAKVEFSTVPSPPKKGLNTIQVKLSGLGGQGVTGAKVTVRFFLPAMPAMGMAAMQNMVTLTDQGGGLYQGRAQLQTGGTWQVTVTAEKNGQSLAARQLSVNAEGGM